MDTSPVRVLFLSAANEMGGAERSLFELTCAFDTEKLAASAAVPPDGPLNRLFALAEIPVYPAPLRRFRRTAHPFLLAGQVRALIQATRTLRKLVETLKIEVLHANTDSAAMVAWEVSRETGVPFLWHCRDLRPLGPLSKLFSLSSAKAVAISHAVEKHLLDQGVKRERLQLIVNGIDLARFHPAVDRAGIASKARQELEIPQHAPVLTCIGAWVPWKRHELFLEALALVRKRHPHAVGMLVGSDLFHQNEGYAKELVALAEHLGFDAQSLRMLDQRNDIPELLAASDLVVAPSANEPFGRVLVEAGASGVPVVGTDSGAKPEIIQHGETGLLVAQDDPAAMSAAINELLEDPARREKMGLQARERVAQLFDVKRAAREMTDLLWATARG